MCLRKPCGNGLHQIVVDENGDIYGCDQSRSNKSLRFGNVNTDCYSNIFNSSIAVELRKLSSDANPKCRSCALNNICGFCVTRGIGQHGTIHAKMPEGYECLIYSMIVPQLFLDLLNPQKASILNGWVK